MHLVALDLDHASLCSGPRSLSLDTCLGIIQSSSTVMSMESAPTTSTCVKPADSVCLSARHALRDALTVLHAFPVGEWLALVQHAHSRAARGLLD